MFEIEGMLYDFCVENFSYISMMSYLVFFFLKFMMLHHMQASQERFSTKL
jgi:hypothetical protein